ncbi:MAG TPA: hypothetical protein VEB39_04445 [Sphingomicrobium sp.]|nr:hypothetical protein [Sphingomicrobium sp.]
MAIFAIGLTTSGYALGDGFRRYKLAEQRSVTVRGVSERNVTADLATWRPGQSPSPMRAPSWAPSSNRSTSRRERFAPSSSAPVSGRGMLPTAMFR